MKKSGKENTGWKEEFRIGEESGSGWALGKVFQTFKKTCLRLCGSGMDLTVPRSGWSRHCKSDRQPRSGEYQVERMLPSSGKPHGCGKKQSGLWGRCLTGKYREKCHISGHKHPVTSYMNQGKEDRGVNSRNSRNSRKGTMHLPPEDSAKVLLGE